LFRKALHSYTFSDSNFCFFDNTTTLDSIFRDYPKQNTLYIRVIRFSIEAASVRYGN